MQTKNLKLRSGNALKPPMQAAEGTRAAKRHPRAAAHPNYPSPPQCPWPLCFGVETR